MFTLQQAVADIQRGDEFGGPASALNVTGLG
jgi:hypothetical protein